MKDLQAGGATARKSVGRVFAREEQPSQFPDSPTVNEEAQFARLRTKTRNVAE